MSGSVCVKFVIDLTILKKRTSTVTLRSRDFSIFFVIVAENVCTQFGIDLGIMRARVRSRFSRARPPYVLPSYISNIDAKIDSNRLGKSHARTHRHTDIHTYTNIHLYRIEDLA
jgi:hypothetical protein